MKEQRAFPRFDIKLVTRAESSYAAFLIDHDTIEPNERAGGKGGTRRLSGRDQAGLAMTRCRYDSFGDAVESVLTGVGEGRAECNSAIQQIENLRYEVAVTESRRPNGVAEQVGKEVANGKGEWVQR